MSGVSLRAIGKVLVKKCKVVGDPNEDINLLGDLVFVGGKIGCKAPMEIH